MNQPPNESPRQVDIWPILIVMGVMALELVFITGTVVYWDRKGKLCHAVAQNFSYIYRAKEYQYDAMYHTKFES